MSRLSHNQLPDELPDPRDPELEPLSLTAVRVYNAARRETRLAESGEGEVWLAVNDVCFILAVLHNAWLECVASPSVLVAPSAPTPHSCTRADARMKPHLTCRLLAWDQALAQIARAARLAYDTHVLTMFEPGGSTLARPAFGVGFGYGRRHVPPSREFVQAYVQEAMEWWWLARLRALAETRLPKGYASVLDSVPVLRRASPTPPASPAGSPVLVPLDATSAALRREGDTGLPFDSAYAHRSLHAVIGWRANAQVGVLALHVERTRWVWYSDFRPSDLARSVLAEAGVSPLLSQPGLPGSLRGDAWL